MQAATTQREGDNSNDSGKDLVVSTGTEPELAKIEQAIATIDSAPWRLDIDENGDWAIWFHADLQRDPRRIIVSFEDQLSPNERAAGAWLIESRETTLSLIAALRAVRMAHYTLQGEHDKLKAYIAGVFNRQLPSDASLSMGEAYERGHSDGSAYIEEVCAAEQQASTEWHHKFDMERERLKYLRGKVEEVKAELDHKRTNFGPTELEQGESCIVEWVLRILDGKQIDKPSSLLRIGEEGGVTHAGQV